MIVTHILRSRDTMQAMSANTLHMHGATNIIAHSPLLQVGMKIIFIDRTHVALARKGDIALSIHPFVCQFVCPSSPV